MGKWKNIAGIALAPFTAGASLLATDYAKNGYNEITGKNSAREQNEAQKALQEHTNQMSIDLANSAHQREVADLQKAGLNPILSAGGTGAGTPTLGTAQVQNELPGGLMSQATQAASIYGAISTAKQQQSLSELQNAQTSAVPSQIQMNQAEAAKAMAEAGYKQKEIDYYMENGVFPGATTTKSTSTPWGSSSETIPVGTKEPQNANSAKKAIDQRKAKDKETKETENSIKEIHKKYGGWWY